LTGKVNTWSRILLFGSEKHRKEKGGGTTLEGEEIRGLGKGNWGRKRFPINKSLGETLGGKGTVTQDSAVKVEEPSPMKGKGRPFVSTISLAVGNPDRYRSCGLKKGRRKGKDDQCKTREERGIKKRNAVGRLQGGKQSGRKKKRKKKKEGKRSLKERGMNPGPSEAQFCRQRVITAAKRRLVSGGGGEEA